MSQRYNPDAYPGWWALWALLAVALFMGTLGGGTEKREQKNLNGSAPAFVRAA